MDGCENPKEVAKTWNWRHSIGKWEGDRMAIDTFGLNGEACLDNSGHVFSDSIHLIERVRRVDQNNLFIEGTVEDPKSHAMTSTGNTTATLQPGRIIREDLACGGVMNGD